MTNKFTNVPNDVDTKIISQINSVFGGYDILYQKWCWDGILAESIIFLSDDIKNIEEKMLIADVQESPLVNEGSEITFKKSGSGYTFINFNFDVL